MGRARVFSAICLSRIFAGSRNLASMPIFDGRHFWSRGVSWRRNQMVRPFLVSATFLGMQENEIFEEEMKENEIYEGEM